MTPAFPIESVWGGAASEVLEKAGKDVLAHIILNSTRNVACGKTHIGGDIAVGLWTESGRREYRNNNATFYFLRRRRVHPFGSKYKLLLCQKCCDIALKAFEDLALKALKGERREQPLTVLKKEKTEKELREEAGLVEPKRPPGTEKMTGHLDEGSKGGLCGEAGSGFKTNFLPWINCPNCQVHLDSLSGVGLLFYRGYFVETVETDKSSPFE